MADANPAEPDHEAERANSPASTGSAGSAAGAGAGAGAEAAGASPAAVTSDTSAKEDLLAQATAKKTLGNKMFQEDNFQGAIAAYTAGIELHPTAVLYANRAFAQLKVEAFGLAIADADKAIELDPKYAKGFYRRGSAHMALGKYKDARKDFRAAVMLKPKDKDARKKYSHCVKQEKRLAFEKAIQTDDAPSAADSIDVDSIVVPASYSGPRLPESGITRDFVLELMNVFKGQGKLHKKYCLQILKAMKEYMRKQPSLVRITVPPPSGDTEPHINVCGDTHGQYYDLLNIFKLAGLPSEDNMFLFNGDFVDRGSFSVENVLVLFAWKLLYPNSFFLSRGNHETINMNKVYGFEGEVKHKFDMKVMAVFTEVFQALPLAHLINDRVFCVHGGLPASTATTMKDVEAIDRFREPPDSGLMSDLLWSDPRPFNGVGPSKRGVGVAFGPDITAGFCDTNGLQCVVRSHEVKEEGYLVEHEGKCITVFSAPNYCDQMGNKGAYIRFTHDCKPEFNKFTHVPHPPIKPMAYATSLGLFGL